MINSPPELTPELRQARRALEGVSGVTIRQDWQWNDLVRRWVLQCQLSPVGISTQSPFHSTVWYILAEPLYPWGKMKCHPAKDGGLDGRHCIIASQKLVRSRNDRTLLSCMKAVPA